MSEFRVWAPAARRVELVVGEERRAMERDRDARGGDDRGWWVLEAPDLGADTEYAFSLDGGPPRPDPRSRWQPHGVDGPSRLVELSDPADGGAGTATIAAGEWRGFHLPAAVLYELHIGTFSPKGTFDGAIERLDHLVELGVTAVSILPVNAFPGRHGWGYDGVGLWAVQDSYGGPHGLRRFVDACHGRGLGVILDVVYNHLGPSGNHLAEFGPYFTDRYATPWGEAPNLDGGGSDEVRRFFIENGLMWMRDYGIDGLRIDAVHAIVDTSAVHLLEELAVDTERLAAELGRPLWLIAESDLNDPRLLWSRERGGYGLHAQWSDDFHHALHAALTGETAGYYADFGRVSDIATALRHAYVYAGRHSGFRGRRHGRPADGLAGHRFLGYLQNHDQVGNRAIGDRIHHIVGTDLQKVGAAILMASPFVPMVFQGEEWAAASPFQYFTDHTDPELGEAVRKGRRAEFATFGWEPERVPDPQDPETFMRSRLDWTELDDDEHADMLRWYRELIAFRRARTALANGRRDDVDVVADDECDTLLIRRGQGEATVLVCCNLGGQDASLLVPEGLPDLGIRMASHPDVRLKSRSGSERAAAEPENGSAGEADLSVRVLLPPRSVGVLVGAG